MKIPCGFIFLGKNWQRRVEHLGAKPTYDPEGGVAGLMRSANHKRSLSGREVRAQHFLLILRHYFDQSSIGRPRRCILRTLSAFRFCYSY